MTMKIQKKGVFLQKISSIQQDMNDKIFLTVKEWADEDRPREKMLSLGKKQLSNAELIAILIRTGLPGKSAVDVAKEILASCGNSLTALSQLDFPQLNATKGMALAKSTTLMAALELGWRMQGEIDSEKVIIVRDSTDCFNIMVRQLADLDHEEFWAIYLNNHNKLLGTQRIAMGGQTDTPVDQRILFRGALECKAVKMMVAHNHPSGHLKPSSDDRKLTQRIMEAGNILGISLLDHIIIGIEPTGRTTYYSFHDNGQV